MSRIAWALVGCLSPALAQSGGWEILAFRTQQGLEGWDPSGFSTVLETYGLQAAVPATDGLSRFYWRGLAARTARSDSLRAEWLGFGAEWRLEHPTWYWGVGLGLDARLEHAQAAPQILPLGGSGLLQTMRPGFEQTTVRPVAIVQVQGPLLPIPYLPGPAQIEGPVQPILRAGLEYTLLRPPGSREFRTFVNSQNRLQWTLQFGLRFR